MKNIPKTIKSVMMMFLAASIMTAMISGNVYAADPERLIVDMQGATCTGVGYEQGADLLKGNSSPCMNVPSGERLSNVKLLWMGGSSSDGVACGGAKHAICAGSATVPLSNGASGTVCSYTEPGTYPARTSTLSYSVSSTTCSGKKAWRVTFTGQRSGGSGPR